MQIIEISIHLMFIFWEMHAVNLKTKHTILHTVNIINVELYLGSHCIPTGPQFNKVMPLALLRVHILIMKLSDEVNLFYNSFQTWIWSASQSISRNSNKKR